MKKLRLLVTKDCNRSCEGCCNKDWDLDNIPIITNFTEYSCIMITGGEPLLYYIKVLDLVRKIKYQTSVPIYLYTAYPIQPGLLKTLDGITVTLHERKDVDRFLCYDFELSKISDINYKSLRLNIFKGISIPRFKHHWKVKDNIEWIKNCPLPHDEVFGQIRDLL